jgi:hypothetical protein
MQRQKLLALYENVARLQKVDDSESHFARHDSLKKDELGKHFPFELVLLEIAGEARLNLND